MGIKWCPYKALTPRDPSWAWRSTMKSFKKITNASSHQPYLHPQVGRTCGFGNHVSDSSYVSAGPRYPWLYTYLCNSWMLFLVQYKLQHFSGLQLLQKNWSISFHISLWEGEPSCKTEVGEMHIAYYSHTWLSWLLLLESQHLRHLLQSTSKQKNQLQSLQPQSNK